MERPIFNKVGNMLIDRLLIPVLGVGASIIGGVIGLIGAVAAGWNPAEGIFFGAAGGATAIAWWQYRRRGR